MKRFETRRASICESICFFAVFRHFKSKKKSIPCNLIRKQTECFTYLFSCFRSYLWTYVCVLVHIVLPTSICSLAWIQMYVFFGARHVIRKDIQLKAFGTWLWNVWSHTFNWFAYESCCNFFFLMPIANVICFMGTSFYQNLSIHKQCFYSPTTLHSSMFMSLNWISQFTFIRLVSDTFPVSLLFVFFFFSLRNSISLFPYTVLTKNESKQNAHEALEILLQR